MLWGLIFQDWQGTILLITAGLGALAALIYVPEPLKHYAVVACIVIASAGKLYSLGFTRAETEAEAKFNAAITQINLENEKAVLAATQRAKVDAEANLRAVHKAMDEQAAQAAAAEVEFQQQLAAIAAAGDAADHDAPQLILKAIRGGR